MKLDEAKEKFIQSWGTLGTAWGINKTMAQIHALLLVSTEPLSTEDMMSALQISRGNANMNTRALIDWGLVSKEHKMGERMEFFKADKDIWAIARQITRERRKRELEPMLKVLAELKEVEGNDQETKAFKSTVNEIDEFTGKVDSIFDKFVRADEHWFYKSIIHLMK